MTYKFQYQNAELFASKMSVYGYRLFIMIDHENGTYFYVSYKPSTDQFVTKVQFVGKKELTDFII